MGRGSPALKYNPGTWWTIGFKISWRLGGNNRRWDCQPEVTPCKLSTIGISTNTIDQATILLLSQPYCTKKIPMVLFSNCISIVSHDIATTPLSITWTDPLATEYSIRTSYYHHEWTYIVNRWYTNDYLFVVDPCTPTQRCIKYSRAHSHICLARHPRLFLERAAKSTDDTNQLSDEKPAVSAHITQLTLEHGTTASKQDSAVHW